MSDTGVRAGERAPTLPEPPVPLFHGFFTVLMASSVLAARY